jgi:hypothetical protein
MMKTSWYAVLAVTVLGAVPLGADTLILRDGRRIEGELVAVTGDAIEFREDTGRRRTLRLDRDEIRAIEFDEDRSGRSSFSRSGQGRPRPRGLREREVIVSGDVAFVDTGIDVRDGQPLYFESIGNVWWRRNDKTGPGGVIGTDRESNKRPMPRRPLAGMIGKVGHESTDLFFIGDDPGPIRVRGSGRLFLGVNDDYFEDNHGNFRVVVFY